MLAVAPATTPYCGPPPLPAELAQAWNLDPVLLTALAAAAALSLWRAPAMGAARARASGLALMVLAIAFLSPLCALSSALFSARILHHLLLISAAAPLLAVAFPLRRPAGPAALPLLVLVHVATVWFWHAPAPYAAALGSDALYALMEASLLGTAVAAWRALLAPEAPLRTALAHLSVIALMGLLGALITFAPLPLYAPHRFSTAAYGLTALEDQQLAGLVMWVPAILPNLAAGLLCLRRSLTRLAGPALRA